MTKGVPRSTELFPLLNIIYVSELSKLNIIGSLYSYADDTALITTGETWDLSIQKAKVSLKKIIEWFSLNNLTLNKSKIFFLTFSNPISTIPDIVNPRAHNINCQSTTHCNCSHIKRETSTKYLGVTFDQNLR